MASCNQCYNAHSIALSNRFGGYKLKKLMGIIVLILLLGVLGWQFRSYLPLPELSLAPKTAPVPARGKIPQMPPPKAKQVPNASTQSIASAQNMETTAISASPTVAPAAQTPPEATATEPNTIQEDQPAAQAAPVTAEDDKTADGETQSMPEPGPSMATAQTQPAAPATDAPSPPTLPATKSDAAAPAATPPAPGPQKNFAAAPPEPVPSPEPDKPAPYTIQVGAYLTKQYADEKLAALTRKGYKAFIFQVTDRRQRTWHAVRFGRFETREDAARTLSKFRSNEKMDAIISRSNSL